MSYKLFGVGSNTKIVKGDGSEYMTAIMHLKPKNKRVCPFQDVANCKDACLDSAGRGVFTSVQSARERKTDLWLTDKVTFMEYMYQDMTVFRRRMHNKGVQPCARPNGTSDIPFERTNLMYDFSDIQFYDYTKTYKRVYSKLPPNYHLTLSYSEANMDYAEKIYQAVLDTNTNMAVVSTLPMPKKFRGLDCINGDEDDLRFLDPQGVVVWLSAKGKAKKDTSGFVIH
jgi:hypothetical protein